MSAPTTHLGETAVFRRPNKDNPAHHGTIVAVGFYQDRPEFQCPTSFWYLLEMPDGTNETVFAEGYGIVRHGNQFACTECKGLGTPPWPDGDKFRDAVWPGDCPACKGSRVIQPGQTWEAP